MFHKQFQIDSHIASNNQGTTIKDLPRLFY